MKRIVLCGDLHAGHRAGLTFPTYQTAIPGEIYYRIQVELWDYYARLIESLRPIHLMVCNGDAIDGPGPRSGGTELITTDINKQCDIAYECLKFAEAENYALSYGTAYHTGTCNDDEKRIAEKLNAPIKSHLWVDVEGVVFDIRHHIGNSSVPYGKGTPIGKEWLSNYLWSAHEEQPKANVIVRSHVHNHFYCGDPDWLGMTLPALQGQGSKFGSRRCSQVVHFGLVWFDCENGGYTWNKRILRAEAQRQIPLKF